MCPLWPFHYLIIYLVLFSSLFYFVVVSSASTKSWNVTFTPAQILRTHISEVTKVHFNVTEFDDNTRTSIVSVICPDILQCTPSYITVPRTSKQFSSSFNVTPTFMGAVNVKLRLLSEGKWFVFLVILFEMLYPSPQTGQTYTYVDATLEIRSYEYFAPD